MRRREEEYLEAIYIVKLNKGVVRVKDLALMLKVKPSSIVAYLTRLSSKGLVRYVKGEHIELTLKGEEMAKRIYHKHLVIREFLHRVLGLPRDIAEEDACYIEHGVHDETVKRMEEIISKVK